MRSTVLAQGPPTTDYPLATAPPGNRFDPPSSGSLRLLNLPPHGSLTDEVRVGTLDRNCQPGVSLAQPTVPAARLPRPSLSGVDASGDKPPAVVATAAAIARWSPPQSPGGRRRGSPQPRAVVAEHPDARRMRSTVRPFDRAGRAGRAGRASPHRRTVEIASVRPTFGRRSPTAVSRIESGASKSLTRQGAWLKSRYRGR
jgi:hypothetical protein